MSAPALSVVIPTYRRREALCQVLAACARQSLRAAQFEVIVSVDEDSPGDRDDLKAPYPYELRVTHGPHGGPAAARNRGAALTRGEVILFLDDDIVPAGDCLAQHWRAQERAGGERVGLGWVRLAPGARTPWERYLTRRYDEHFAKLRRPDYAPTFWDCLSGSLSLPRGLFARSGGFDPSFTRHEDVELGYRLDQLGACFVFVPSAVGEHRFRRSVAAGLKDARAEGHSAALLSQCHPALRPRLLAARWQRYAGAGRHVMRWAVADGARHQRLAEQMGRLVERVEASALPVPSRRPLYQLASHLHFWLGVRAADAKLLSRSDYVDEPP